MNDKGSNHTVIMSRCRIPELVAMGAQSNHRILDIRKNRPRRTVNKRTMQRNRKVNICRVPVSEESGNPIIGRTYVDAS